MSKDQSRNLKVDQQLIKIASKVNSHILITGATGTGKSTLAKKIHLESSRAKEKFVTINLATLHEGTLESELFGHERGAFTSADTKRIGRLELAQNGTVFLDEIGELPLRYQTKLLEFLQTKVITPVGGRTELTLNVRIIAATQKNLETEVRAGRFREDLFHRLRVIHIETKSVWERRDEFDKIVHDCLSDLAQVTGRRVLKLSEDLASALENHSWPGNIRELKNVLEYALIVSGDEELLSSHHLPSWFNRDQSSQMAQPVLGVAEIPMSLDYSKTLQDFEKYYVQAALRKNQGRVNATARLLGLNKTTFLRKLNRLEIDPRLVH